MNPIAIETRQARRAWSLDRFSSLSRLPEILAIACPVDGGPPAVDTHDARKLKSYLMDAESEVSVAMESLAVLETIADTTTRKESPQEFIGLPSLWLLLSGLSRALGDGIAALDDHEKKGQK